MNTQYAAKLISLVAIFSCQIHALCMSSDSTKLQENDSTDKASKLLVSPEWLAEQIKTNSNLRIIDLPMRKTNYETGHIPEAVYLDWRSDIINSDQRELYRLPEKAAMEKLLSRIGVKPDTTVVLTDNMLNRTAVRMYYTLKYFGHKDVRILNGGTPVWNASKRKLSKDVPEIAPSDYKISNVSEEYVVKLETVQKAINDDCQLIDGRPSDQYTGEVPGKAFHTNKEHSRLGHVPSATSIPWKENLNPDGTFKSIVELRKLYQSKGIDVGGEVITYCNEGLHATMPWFIIRELFGNEEVTVYDNSMVEWANRDDTPLVKKLRIEKQNER